MGFANPPILWGLLVIPLLLILTLWRWRPERLLIPSIQLWHRIRDRHPPLKAARRPFLSWQTLLQILIVTLGITAAARPFIMVLSPQPQRIAVFLDTSASMHTLTTSGRTRLEEGIRVLEDLLDRLTPQDHITLVTRSKRWEGTPTWIKVHLASLRPQHIYLSEQEISRHLQILRITDPQAHLFYFGDQQITGIDQEIQQILVGDQKTDNIGITEFSLERKEKEIYHIFALVENFGDVTRPVQVRLVLDGKTVSTKRVQIKPGSWPVIFQVDTKGVHTILIKLDIKDNLALDNIVGAVREEVGKLSVQIFGQPSQHLLKALHAIPDVEILSSTKLEADVDVKVYYETLPLEGIKHGEIVLINPPGDIIGDFRLGEMLPSKEVQLSDHPILSDVDSSEIKPFQGREILYEGPGHIQKLMTIDGKPVCTLWHTPRNSILLFSFAFDPLEGNKIGWTFFPSFPIFWANYVEFVKTRKGKKGFVHSKSGEVMLFPSKYKGLSLRAPGGVILPLQDIAGRLGIIPKTIGPYELETPRGKRIIRYVNLLNRLESKNTGSYRGIRLDQDRPRQSRPLDLTSYVVLACMVCVLIYWYIEHKKGE